jgi:hypothetical protein
MRLSLRTAPALVLLVALLPTPATSAPPRSAATERISFDQPVYVSEGPTHQAAEPSIRVDETDPNQRIWIGAPTGVGVNVRPLPAGENGDLVWSSDDDGRSWRFHAGPGGVGSPTILGGGDTDLAIGPGPEVYVTGLTLANVTLAASCDNGETFTTNPVSNAGTVEDRQWIDTWEDHPKPALTAPDLLLNYGGVGERRIWFHQVVSPLCAPPVAGPRIDTSTSECVGAIFDPDCYQWPGNIAVDETTGDVYVTFNTFGNDEPPHNDDVVVTRIDQGAVRPVTPADVHPVVAANDRPDTFDSFTVVAVDRGGNVYVVWSERHPERQATDTMLAVSKDRGQTWTEPILVNRGPQTTTFPWIVAGDPGRIDIVYYGTNAKGPSPEEVPITSRWRVWMAQSVNALRTTPTFREVPATPFIHEGFVCTSGTGCAPGTRDLLDFFQIDVDAQGLANIAYTDNLNTPPDPATGDPHQEWVTFVQQKGGPTLYG